MAMAQAQDQQQSQGSGFSLPNIPGVPKINDLKRAGKDFAKQMAKQAFNQLKQKAVAFIAANPEIVAIAIVILVVVALFLIIITTIIGQNNSSNGDSGTIISPTPVQGQLLTCPSGDYSTCLKQDFNIVVFGGNAADATKIFNAFAFAGQSQQYLSLLTKNGQSLRIFIIGSDPKVCSGLTIGFAGIIKLSDGACFNIPDSSFRYLLIHESGHVLAARNSRLYQSFPWTQYQTQDGSSCYDQGYIKSYALRCGSSCGIRPKDEAFAESVADSLTSSSNAKTGAAQLIHFATDCPATYNWFKDNVFGGFTFF
jgi:hypothetical protein